MTHAKRLLEQLLLRVSQRLRGYVSRRAKDSAGRLFGRSPAVGAVRFGDLRRSKPISGVFGFDRGQPVDRHYVDTFLARRSADIQGRVLEISESTYTKRFGGERAERVDVLHFDPAAPGETTIVDDLTVGSQLESGAYDCVLLVETLHVIFDVRRALETAHRILAPGGVLLAVDPGIAQISRFDADRWGDHWRFTTQALRRLAREAFPDGDITVEALGNVTAAVALLHGLAVEDLRPRDLEPHDPDYEVLIGLRAAKAPRATLPGGSAGEHGRHPQ